MQKWEYLKLAFDRRMKVYAYVYETKTDKHQYSSSTELISILCELGEKGWELVAIDSVGNAPGVYCFKRPTE